MLRALISLMVACLFCPPLHADPRYKNLTTTDDGSILYFSTRFRLRGSDGPPYWKVLAVDANGVRVVEQRTLVRQNYISNFYLVEEPVVSGDGSLVGFTASADCYAGSMIPCMEWEFLHVHHHAELFTLDGSRRNVYPFKLRLSANGRYALLYDGQDSQAAMLAVESGQQSALLVSDLLASVNSTSGARVIAGDGTIAVTKRSATVPVYSTTIRIVRGSATEDIPVPGQVVPGSASIDANAATVFFSSYSPESARYRVMSLDLATRAVVPLVEADKEVLQPVSTNDGQKVLFLTSADLTGSNPKKVAQAFLVDRAGNLRQLTSEDSGIVEAALSGAGAVAYAVTGDDRIIRVDTISGQVSEVLPRVPVIRQSTSLSPGSLGGIVGEGFSKDYFFAELPLPTTLGGLRVLLDGTALPLVAVSSTEVLFQVPWDHPQSESSTITVDVGPGQVLEAPKTEQPISRQNPDFVMLYGWPSTPIAVHSDWSALVTVLAPAREGEVIHTYMTGLGEALPAVSTGTFTPLSPLSPTTNKVSCSFQAGGTSYPATVLWSGLAPGLIGLYQVSLIVPTGMNRSSASLGCGFGVLSRAYATLAVTAPLTP